MDRIVANFPLLTKWMTKQTREILENRVTAN